MNEAIREALLRAEKSGTGVFGAGYRDLTTGEEFYIRGDRPFPTASVVKIFLLCELFRRQKEGTLSLRDRHVLLESEKVNGSGLLHKLSEGADLALMDYVMLMMSISDNTATDILYALLDPESVRKNVLEAFGLRGTKCDFNVRTMLARYYSQSGNCRTHARSAGDGFYYADLDLYSCAAEENDQTTPRDLVTILTRMYEGRAVDPESDKQMLDIMAQCETNARIPALLPPGTRVAHKTGTLDHLANDAGIVYTPKGDYILALSYNGDLASDEEYQGTRLTQVGTPILAQLSREVYDAFLEEKSNA